MYLRFFLGFARKYTMLYSKVCLDAERLTFVVQTTSLVTTDDVYHCFSLYTRIAYCYMTRLDYKLYTSFLCIRRSCLVQK